jgi:hypothetical protein
LRGLKRELELFTTLYTVLVILSTTSLCLLGEKRVDLYVSLNILAYYVSYALVRPGVGGVVVRALNALLLAVFLIIVAFRVYEVLTS